MLQKQEPIGNTDEQVITPQPEIISCGIEELDVILSNIEPVEWEEHREKKYLMRTVERILNTAKVVEIPIVAHNGMIYYWANTHYIPVLREPLQNFLLEAALQCGVPNDTAEFFIFVGKLYKQFLISAARKSRIQEQNGMYINLVNGTLFFDKQGHRFEPHSSDRLIRYCLNFGYNPEAAAPLWQRHLDRSLPIREKQVFLAECSALPFYLGKIEKAPIFVGEHDTGKSTTLDTLKAVYGAENITAESLAALTRADYTGDYARARLDGKLVNIASDISKKIGDEGVAKMLISREKISARDPNEKGFDMERDYARMIFAVNTRDLPQQFFTDPALKKRAAIIVFDQQIAPQDKDTDFAEKIIADELPGILNWMIAGLNRLLETGRLDPPQCCIDAVDKIGKELDPLPGWLEFWEYYPGHSDWITLQEACDSFKRYCKERGAPLLDLKHLSKRLQDLGYKIDRPNHHTGRLLFFQRSAPDSLAPSAPVAPSLEIQDEIELEPGPE